MGTIVERPRKNGSIAYFAQILVMRDSKIVHRESRTFDRRPPAAAWIKKREAELAKPGAALGAKSRAVGATLADVIDRYIAESARAMGSTKAQVLRTIKTFDLAAMACADIASQDYVEFAQELAKGGREPTTVESYLSNLGSIVSIAKPAWGYPLDPQALSDARKVTKMLGVTGKGQSRTRRPTLAELEKLLAYFQGQKTRYPDSIPMAELTLFALFSTRREEEITRIRWEDLDEEGKRVFVRDLKNPGATIGNNVWCDLPQEAIEIIRTTPRTSPQIFPYNSQSVSARFTRACKYLAINDLHFHDLRHEGISRLFEMGWNIPHVATVSGHRSWASLKRYTHIRQTGDKYVGWSWLSDILNGAEISKVETARRDPAALA